ncbi:MAG TPA: spondin domain-containing protein [Vicinamibacteria bacterium]|nr:spondin domain-containing protein [Vicinamibacteria bacterium]
MSTAHHLSVTVGALALAGCGGGGSPSAPSAPPTPPVVTAAPTARYAVTFEATWSAASHPSDFPDDPHLSPLVGGTHSSAVGFWRAGAPATDGIEAMAELGRVTPLDFEVQAAIAAGTAEHLLRGEGIARSPGATTLEFEIGRDRPLVTLVSMIAPSPDWFVGVHDLSLLENGDWVAERAVTLFPYDAGTDHGRSYSSPDLDARPRDSVREISGFPFTFEGRVAPVGTFTFRRVR